MKRILTFILLCVLSTQIVAQEKNINSFISYGTFNITGDNTPYLETYITFDCSSLTYIKQSNGQYNAAINLTVIFKQGESIKNYDKYTVTSPQVSDTTNLEGFFMDIQRYSLPNGEYQMEVTIEDANNKKERPFKVNETVKKGQVYTIIAEDNGWGKLKSGAGWIYLKDNTKKLK